MALDIRRILKIYDDAAIANPRLSISMLQEVTKCIATEPNKYLDLEDSNCEKWLEAGGSSYGENYDFPSLVRKRWVQVLSKPGGDVMAAATQRNNHQQLTSCC